MKTTRILWVIVIVLLLAGCGSPNNANSSQPFIEHTPQLTLEEGETGQSYTIALVMKTLTNPFFVEMERGARQAEADFEIDLVVKTAAQETSIEQQIEIVDQLIREKVDAIVIAPGDSLELIPVLKKAKDAGIIVINIDNQLDPEFSEKMGLVNVPFISVDNEQAAYLSAKYISDQITSPAEVAILEGIRSALNAEARKNGALRAFSENPNITVIAMETAHWKIDEGYEVTKGIFASSPNIKALFCANDMMALGAINYLEETDQSSVLVAAYDALDEAKQALQDGTLQITIDQQAAHQGYLGVEYAVRALNGEELPEETLVDVLPVTAETLE
ncbi:MAG: sugar ABC transporter substrate-binding protein [Anaerolineae bacterium]|jgi:ribose transport system substrate-binding protein|nr:sugar ABC transporter substrate-binding protein [Anaerolineae bacterium]MBT7326012.1 sugar ABC transporter substrate-binding protein [Anaerolineae bacterium]MBT7602384.1 sugar ABC transporter substrate-binding protein [Anaerolineae bacterium]